MALVVILVFAAIDLVLIGRSLPRPLFGDEWRYLYYANNLLDGYFSPRDRVFLWNGPGYPMVLMPFVAAEWTDGARYLNALLHAGALLYAWLILRTRVTVRWAIGAVALLGAYPPLHEHMPLLYTEVLAFFLVTAWAYHSHKADTRLLHRVIAGGCLALLALTKVVFGVVLTVFLIAAAVAWLRRRPHPVLASSAVQAALAFALCLPYLAYTYQLTGRTFYWSSAGANSFYWLTSPHPDEWGDWYHQGWVNDDPVLRAHHKEIIDRTSGIAENPTLSEDEQLLNMSTPEAADVYLQQGVRNVREHPLKFARNWAGNVVRLFLDVPVSVRGTPFWNRYSLSHLPLLTWTVFVVWYAWRHGVPFPQEWVSIATFGLIALGILSLTSGMSRFLI